MGTMSRVTHASGKILITYTVWAQDIDAKRVEAIQMAKIVPEPRFPRVPEPRFPRREQSETTHKLGVKGSLGHLFCFYTYNVNVLWFGLTKVVRKWAKSRHRRRKNDAGNEKKKDC